VPPLPGVFPDYPAPVIRNTDGRTELVTMRWGLPPPPRAGGPPVTNVRNTSSPHWRMWLKPQNRCLVRPIASQNMRRSQTWRPKRKMRFGLLSMRDRPLFAFAGIWTTFNGNRGTKSKPIPGPHQVYRFLTTEANAVVKPIHAKATGQSGSSKLCVIRAA